MEKEKVFLSFVGMRDPFNKKNNSEGAILTLCEEIGPDYIYLFPSCRALADGPGNQTEDNADESKKILQERYSGLECHVLPLNIANATDMDRLYSELKNNMLKILNGLSKKCPDGLDGYEFFFNLASGTPQMRETAKNYIYVSPIKPQFCQAIDPEHLKEGEPRVVFNPPDFTEETLSLSQVENSVDGYHFHSVAEFCAWLARMSKLNERRIIAGIIQNAFSAYEDMDAMRYRTAFSKITKVSDTIGQLSLPSLDTIMTAQKEFLSNVKDEQESENVYNLVDLYFNMERAFSRGHYADVLARFWRLHEGMLYYRLFEKYGIDKRDLQNSDNNSVRRVEMSPYHGEVDRENNRFRADALDMVVKILRDVFHDSDLNYLESQNRRELEELRRLRNKTFIAHGMSPVNKDDVLSCRGLGRKIIDLIPQGKGVNGEFIPDGEEVYNTYPFTLNNMKELANLLKRI